MPIEFVSYMKRVRALKFEERPDYDGLRLLFKDLFYRNGFEYDYNYDWMIKQRRDRLRGYQSQQSQRGEPQSTPTVGDPVTAQQNQEQAVAGQR